MTQADWHGWHGWHSRYDDPNSHVSRRLLVVQSYISRFLDSSAPSPVRIVSICAGDGRDILQTLAARADAGRVSAYLFENDSRNVLRAREHARRSGLDNITVREADASQTEAYDGTLPADLILIAGVFGNVSDDDVRNIIETLPEMCCRGALVIWTRRQRPVHLIGTICKWFSDQGFVDESIGGQEDAVFFAGSHRFVGSPREPGERRKLFTFLR